MGRALGSSREIAPWPGSVQEGQRPTAVPVARGPSPCTASVEPFPPQEPLCVGGSLAACLLRIRVSFLFSSIWKRGFR